MILRCVNKMHSLHEIDETVVNTTSDYAFESQYPHISCKFQRKAWPQLFWSTLSVIPQLVAIEFQLFNLRFQFWILGARFRTNFGSLHSLFALLLLSLTRRPASSCFPCGRLFERCGSLFFWSDWPSRVRYWAAENFRSNGFQVPFMIFDIIFDSAWLPPVVLSVIISPPFWLSLLRSCPSLGFTYSW